MTHEAKESVSNAHVDLNSHSRPSYMVACLILSDLFALLAAVVIGLSWKFAIYGPIHLESYVRLWPFLLVFVAVFAIEGLYSGIALSPPEELRRVTLSSSAVFLFLAAVTVSLRGASTSFTWTLFLALVLALAFVPLMRVLVRRALADKKWWGYPAVVFADEESGRRVVSAMNQEPGLGLKLVALVGEYPGVDHIEGVPTMSALQFIGAAPRFPSISYGVLPLLGTAPGKMQSIADQHGSRFSHLLVIPDLVGLSSLWVQPKNFGGMLGLETRQQVLARQQRLTKRAIDVALISVGGVLIFPLLGLIALAVRLDSPGPVFFGHKRIGRARRDFRAWKFRSMAINGDEILEHHFVNNPEARQEWETTQKLRDDPRVTRVGRLLRSTSLDELPQLWNVLAGEMSLVGPRPIVQSEVARYGDYFNTYTKVEGGVTGLWQVSGRNNTSYEERVSLDTFYVRNWSVWLDLCILFRTIGVVLFRKGAY